MADGTTKPISEIEVGDEVWAVDPGTGESGPRGVEAVWVHGDWLFDLYVVGGSVTTTEDHPFWNESDQSWQQSQHLDVGDLLRTAGGDFVPTVGLDWDSAQWADAYNLDVEDFDTYFVKAGADLVLVHNSDQINLGEGYTGRVDKFNVGGNVDFEIHVFRNGQEVGIWGSSGWFSKHGHSADISVPAGVENRLKGESVDIMRNTGRIGPKGVDDISGDNWRRSRLGC